MLKNRVKSCTNIVIVMGCFYFDMGHHHTFYFVMVGYYKFYFAMGSHYEFYVWFLTAAASQNF